MGAYFAQEEVHSQAESTKGTVMKASIPACACVLIGVGLGYLLHKTDKKAHREGFRLGSHAAV